MQAGNTLLAHSQNLAPINRNIDSALLRTFLACIETGTLQKASERVCRTQAAVSQQLKRLEEVTGTSLFIKQGRKLALTKAGMEMVTYAREFLDVHDKMLRALSSRSTNCLGTICAGLDSHELEVPVLGTSKIVKVTQDPLTQAPGCIEAVRTFEDNFANTRLAPIFDAWKHQHAQHTPVTLDTLTSFGLLARDQDLGKLFAMRSGEVVCVDATQSEAIEYGYDKTGFGHSIEPKLDPSAYCQRRNIWTVCSAANSPAFFSGNPLLPKGYSLDGDEAKYMSSVLNRLVLPVLLPEDLTKDGFSPVGILQVAAWDSSRSYAWLVQGNGEAPPSFSVTEQVVFRV